MKRSELKQLIRETIEEQMIQESEAVDNLVKQIQALSKEEQGILQKKLTDLFKASKSGSLQDAYNELAKNGKIVIMRSEKNRNQLIGFLQYKDQFLNDEKCITSKEHVKYNANAFAEEYPNLAFAFKNNPELMIPSVGGGDDRVPSPLRGYGTSMKDQINGLTRSWKKRLGGADIKVELDKNLERDMPK